MTANHCEKRIDAKNESLRNQRNAKPTECEYNFSLGKKQIDANNELLRNQQNAKPTECEYNFSLGKNE
jgi:hypothetical protein